MARLDRLGDAKAVAQIGAAIGREFSHEIAAAVYLGTEAELDLALDRLVDAGLLFRQGTGTLATYLFKHALVQDAAWGTLLREPRRTLHARIVDAIEALSPEIAENRPEALARHCDEAGLVEKAATLWGKAGQQSLGRSALMEAERQLSRALALIALLPGAPALRREQVKLQVSFANTLMHTKGYSSAQTIAALDEASALIERCEALGEPLDDPLAPFAILYGSFAANFARFNGKLIRDIAAHISTLAEKKREVPMLMFGHRLTGAAALYTGDLVNGRLHLDRAIELCEPHQRHILMTRFNLDIAVTNFAWRSLALWLSGFPDAAQADAKRALTDARTANHAPSLYFSLMTATLTPLECGDQTTARCNIEELNSLATDFAATWKDIAWKYNLMLAAKEGDSLRAAQFVSSYSKRRAAGDFLWAPILLALSAKTFAELGQFDEAFRFLNEAMIALEQTGERWAAAEVSRIAGEIVLRSTNRDVEKARSYFGQAIKIALAQEARSLELRAAMSLARLLRDEGARRAAYDLLTPTYAWFTEGFETRDLKDAKALLDELS